MIEVPLPALREQYLTLESDEASRGERGDAQVPWAARITFGGPYAVPVTADYVADDPVLRAFVEQEAARNVYHILHLSISFAAEPATPRLEKAAVELRLSSNATAAEPVAWSMTPLRITDSVQVERTFRLGPQLKLLNVEATLGDVAQTVSEKRSEVFLQAQRELRPDPAWEFRRTRTMNLYGSYRLIMVVRATKDSTTTVSGTVRAVTKGNLLRRYRGDLPNPLSLAAVF